MIKSQGNFGTSLYISLPPEYQAKNPLDFFLQLGINLATY